MGNHLPVFLIVILLAGSTGLQARDKSYAIKGFVGNSSTEVAAGVQVRLVDMSKGQIIDSVTTNMFGRYKFKGLKPGSYLINLTSINKKVEIIGRDVRLDIDLSKAGGEMDYAGDVIKQVVEDLVRAQVKGQSNQGSDAMSGANDTELARQIAGVYWGYSGSTERKIGLCPDGSYREFTESGYSGQGHDSSGNQTLAWGTANQNSGSGSWVIQGNGQQGTISVRYNNNQVEELRYQQSGESGCLVINGNTLCRTSAGC